jgi:hypothetical protein
MVLRPVGPAARSAPVQAFLISSLVLVLLVGAGVLAITFLRSRLLDQRLASGAGSGHGDWESALAGYKNLRDKGVLSDEEYRKITTLVEPHVRSDLTMSNGPSRSSGPAMTDRRPTQGRQIPDCRPEPPDFRPEPPDPPSPNPTRT